MCLLSAALIASAAGCAPASKKVDLAALVKASVDARAAGHEDLAANELKEAYDSLPPQGAAGRIEAVNMLYVPTLDLAEALRKSGRLSLSNTMYDKAIEIESECTISGKPSATELKRETEKVFEAEESILATASTNNEVKVKTKELQDETRSLADRLNTDDAKALEAEAAKHLDVIRNSFGSTSFQYIDIFRVYSEILTRLNKAPKAVQILERDIRQLSDFKIEAVKSGDIDAAQNAYFLVPLNYELAYLQVKTGQLDDAEKSARKSCELAEFIGGDMKPRLIIARLTLASVLKAKGEDSQALKILHETLPLMHKEKFGRDTQRCESLIEQIEKEPPDKQ